MVVIPLVTPTAGGRIEDFPYGGQGMSRPPLLQAVLEAVQRPPPPTPAVLPGVLLLPSLLPLSGGEGVATAVILLAALLLVGVAHTHPPAHQADVTGVVLLLLEGAAGRVGLGLTGLAGAAAR